MAFTHAADLRNDIANDVLTQLDAGAGASLIVIQTSASVEVATLTASDPAGSVTGAVLTWSAITDDTSATGGTADRFKLTDSVPADVIIGNTGSVTATGGGGDIELSTVTIGAGATVSISSLTYTAPL